MTNFLKKGITTVTESKVARTGWEYLKWHHGSSSRPMDQWSYQIDGGRKG
jgi:hypothetical protein